MYAVSKREDPSVTISHPHRAGFRRRAVAVLLITSLGTALYSSLAVHPYSSHSPKRVAINHVHMTEASFGSIPYSRAAPAADGLDPRQFHDLSEAALSGVPQQLHGLAKAPFSGTFPLSAFESARKTFLDAFSWMFPSSPQQAPAASENIGRKVEKVASCLSGGPPVMRVTSSRYSFSSTDSGPIQFAFAENHQQRGGKGPQGKAVSSAKNKTVVPRLQFIESMGREFTSVFPVSVLLAGVHVAAPAPPGYPHPHDPAHLRGEADTTEPDVKQLPYVCQTAESTAVWIENGSKSGNDSSASDEGGTSGGGKRRTGGRRFHLRTFTERPAWGILNVTALGAGRLKRWSLGHPLMPSLIGEKVGLLAH